MRRGFLRRLLRLGRRAPKTDRILPTKATVKEQLPKGWFRQKQTLGRDRLMAHKLMMLHPLERAMAFQTWRGLAHTLSPRQWGEHCSDIDNLKSKKR